MNKIIKVLPCLLIISFNCLLLLTHFANAEDNWSSQYTFPSTTQKNVQLLQADLIKKGETDYYDNLGQTYIGQVNTYYQEGNFNNISSTSNSNIDISSYYSKTSTIGSQTNATTNISNSGSGNIDVSNTSNSIGDQDASIDISTNESNTGDVTLGESIQILPDEH